MFEGVAGASTSREEDAHVIVASEDVLLSACKELAPEAT